MLHGQTFLLVMMSRLDMHKQTQANTIILHLVLINNSISADHAADFCRCSYILETALA